MWVISLSDFNDQTANLKIVPWQKQIKSLKFATE